MHFQRHLTRVQDMDPRPGFPQASSTLLHAVLSTPQCSEWAIARMDPEQGVGVRRWEQCLRVNSGGHDMQKAVKAMRKNRKKGQSMLWWISLEKKWKQFTDFIIAWRGSQWGVGVRRGRHLGGEGSWQLGGRTSRWAVVNSRYQVRTGCYQTFNAESFRLFLQQGRREGVIKISSLS